MPELLTRTNVEHFPIHSGYTPLPSPSEIQPAASYTLHEIM